MNLLEYIQAKRNTASACAAGKDGNNKEFSRCLGSMSRYTGGEDPDILAAVDPEFIAGYYKYIEREYADASPYTRRKHTVALRTIVRNAISEGLLPAVDVFPVEPGKKTYAPAMHGFRGEVSRLLKADADLGWYYVAAMVQGVEFEALNEITPDNAPAILLTIADRIGVQAPCGRLFPDMKRDLIRALRVNNISLLAEGRVIVDFLSLAIELGAPAAEVTKAAATVRHGISPDLSVLKRFAGEKVIKDMGVLPQWHILVSCSSAKRAQSMKAEVLDATARGKLNLGADALYDPMDMLAPDAKAGGHAAINRYLFFKSDQADINKVPQIIQDTYVMHRPGTSVPATVRESELRLLQTALRDFRDDIALVDRDAWISAHERQLGLMKRVRIIDGIFAGREAIIADIRSGEGNQRAYLLQFAHDTVTIKIYLSGIHLEPIEN